MIKNYEDSAFLTTTPAWKCKHCSKTYNQNEDYARRCCATDVPCSATGCNNRIVTKVSKSYYAAVQHCQECKDLDKHKRQQKQEKIWAERERREWDGEAMLYSDELDIFFVDIDDAYCYLDEGYPTLEDLKLRICLPVKAPYFDMQDHLSDYLPDDVDGSYPSGYQEIEKVVNDYLEGLKPLSWEPGPYAMNVSEYEEIAEPEKEETESALLRQTSNYIIQSQEAQKIFKVELLDGFITRKLPEKTCNCSTTTLLLQGCQCGGV